MSNSLWPHGLYSPWNSQGQDTGVGCHSLLQGIFPMLESNWDLLHCERILYQLSLLGKPITKVLISLAYESSFHCWFLPILSFIVDCLCLCFLLFYFLFIVTAGLSLLLSPLKITFWCDSFFCFIIYQFLLFIGNNLFLLLSLHFILL